jgi:hypothetical protein
MDTQPDKQQKMENRQNSWARPVSKLTFGDVPEGALYLNVDGRGVTGPLQGFGKLWQKTFRVRLTSVQLTPQEVVQTWKENFPKFHAKENRFYPSKTGIVPGEVVLINADTPGGPVSTGMLVLYVDDEAFTLMTPEGHPESGWVTFSAFVQDGELIAQVQTLARADDPLYELAFLVAGDKLQDSIWINVLSSLARYYGVREDILKEKVCLDPKRQWLRIGNIWHNAQVRTILYTMGAPLRWMARPFRNK